MTRLNRLAMAGVTMLALFAPVAPRAGRRRASAAGRAIAAARMLPFRRTTRWQCRASGSAAAAERPDLSRINGIAF